MNSDLQNLIKAALVDGEISVREMNVLKSKAEQLNITDDELQMFIDAEKFNQSSSKNTAESEPSSLGRSKEPSFAHQAKDKPRQNQGQRASVQQTVQSSGSGLGIRKGLKRLDIFEFGILDWFDDVDADGFLTFLKGIFIFAAICSIIAIIYFLYQWVLANILFVAAGISILVILILLYIFNRN